ncbi:LAQU0S03e06172g1_1 [Lachancea quebecensis]|uniref:LAQU0S03e06172g1_1 n=1 Tax=Lachancea quebecensis TaxID=1654605 RepID=A0A0P1KPX0_9SACH|nr:LAQU0S03e06172g1_1 [Lachancea quebecensis]
MAVRTIGPHQSLSTRYSTSVKHQEEKHGGSKRKQFRKWLHNLKEHSPSPDYRDEETVLIDVADSRLGFLDPLSYVPVLTTSEAAMLDCETQLPARTHSKRLREFLRGHLKRRLSSHKNGGISNSQGRGPESLLDASCIEADRAAVGGCPSQLDGSACASEPVSLRREVTEDVKPTKWENDSQSSELADDAKGACLDRPHEADSGQNSLKRTSDSPLADNSTEAKRTCFEKEPDRSGDDFIDESSSVYSDVPSLEASICKTPPAVLTKPCEDGVTPSRSFGNDSSAPLEDKLYVVIEKLKAAVHPRSSGSAKFEQTDFSASSGKTGSPGYEPTFIRVPTFRQSLRRMNARGLLEDVRNGTIKEEDLLKLAKKEPESFNFRDAKFFEKDSEVSRSSESSKSLESSHFYSVKFDKFSHLLMYDATKRCHPDRWGTLPSANLSTGGKGVGASPSIFKNAVCDKESVRSQKPILKCRSNTRAEVESLRAEDCDKVDVFAFLKFFEHHEAQRRSEELSLSRIREQQLTNYYANDHVYNSVRSGSLKFAALDFNRSKKATEINIGRELRGPDRRISSCPSMRDWDLGRKRRSDISQNCY